ncbi:MAG TPA: hypothetical protein DCZ10_00340 [Pelotomaculum sp.]|nr:hypothetical protein [Pelotomaculum sp.]
MRKNMLIPVLVFALAMLTGIGSAFTAAPDKPAAYDQAENNSSGATAGELEVDSIITAAMQKSLAGLGYEPGPIDGIFGPKTKRALTGFQKSQGLPADGVVNFQTIMALTTSGSGSENFTAILVQKKLTDLGYEPGPNDGIWGPKTRKALMKFQIRNRLLPHGIIDPQTIRLLLDSGDRSSGVN